jgi:hypothetical protein
MRSGPDYFWLNLHFASLAMPTTGVLAQHFGLVYEAHSAQSFAQPHDIILSSDQQYLKGQVWFSDTYNDRIVRYRVSE